MTVLDAFDRFIYDKRLAYLSESSIRDYSFMLLPFRRFVGDSLPISELTKELVDNYIFSLQSGTYARSTVSTYVRNLRIFLTYVDSLESLSFSPRKIKIPKPSKKQAYIYNDEEIAQLFAAVASHSDWLTARNRAMIALMLDSGIRRSEVSSIQVVDVDFYSGRLKVHGKGDKERFVALGSYSAAFLKKYMALCPYPIHANLFLDTNGSPLSPNAVRLIMTRLSEKMPFPVSAHLLRHNFATNWCLDQLNAGQQIDSLVLQALLGHESLQTTQIYIHCALALHAVKSSHSHLDRLSGLV